LLEANTIFIDNQTGVPEVLDMATTQLNSSKWPLTHKPVTIVQDKSAADLMATFTKIYGYRTAGQPSDDWDTGQTPASGIKMRSMSEVPQKSNRECRGIVRYGQRRRICGTDVRDGTVESRRERARVPVATGGRVRSEGLAHGPLTRKLRRPLEMQVAVTRSPKVPRLVTFPATM
jgi:hypothetical protein